jgi:hypothetical protein
VPVLALPAAAAAAAAAAARYCCKACQVEHWKWHKALCRGKAEPAAAAAGAVAAAAAAGAAAQQLSRLHNWSPMIAAQRWLGFVMQFALFVQPQLVL